MSPLSIVSKIITVLIVRSWFIQVFGDYLAVRCIAIMVALAGHMLFTRWWRRHQERKGRDAMMRAHSQLVAMPTQQRRGLAAKASRAEPPTSTPTPNDLIEEMPLEVEDQSPAFDAELDEEDDEEAAFESEMETVLLEHCQH